MGETPQLFPVLLGLGGFYVMRGELQTARELGEQILSLAQSMPNPTSSCELTMRLGEHLVSIWESLPLPRAHLEKALPSMTPKSIAPLPFFMGKTLGWRAHLVRPGLCGLGYPDQALKKSHEALTLAQELSHPFSLAFALSAAAMFHQFRREEQAVQELARQLIALSIEQGFAFPWRGKCTAGLGAGRAGNRRKGTAQIRQG